jgi:hypothetical protein
MNNENLKVTSDTVDCFSLAPLNLTPEILACRVVLRTIFACAANDFTVSHETNSLPGNKIYVVCLKKFSLKKNIVQQF